MSSYQSEIAPGVSLDPVTTESLEHFGKRRRMLLLLRAVAVGVIAFVGLMMLITLLDYLLMMPDGVRWALSLVSYVITAVAVWKSGLRDCFRNDPRSLARQMQSAAPTLNDDLLSAVELADPDDVNGSPAFVERLQGRVARRVSSLDVKRLLPVGLIRRWLSTGAIIFAVCVTLLCIPSMQFGRRFARAMLPGVAIERASKTQVEILEPSPASGYVAEGDAVAVIVKISGEPADEVMMYWRTEDGIVGESKMTPRANASALVASDDDTTTIRTTDTFAANLSVGSVPLDYQIRAGDAITLWNTLSPLPRPRVKMFSKRYVFPTYADLNDRVEEDEHGDLKAITGTTAEVTTTFDEPVKDAIVRYGNRGVEIEMKATDDSGLQFVASIPIKTAGQYQIDATSVRSGLNNPFSATYTITPVIDVPPVVRWSNDLGELDLVSPLSVIDLAGSIQDDLPVDKIIQEFNVNGGDFQRNMIAVDAPQRESTPTWQWDLLDRRSRGTESDKLQGGDIVQTRLVAIDRRGNRGESKLISLLIADEGFDPDRHLHLEDLSKNVADVMTWTSHVRGMAELIEKAAKADAPDEVASIKKGAEELKAITPPLLKTLGLSLASSGQPMDANLYELLGQAVIELDGRMQLLTQDTAETLTATNENWQKNRERYLREATNTARGALHQAQRIETVAQGMMTQALTVAIARDALALQQSLQPLIGENRIVPASRFSRYLQVAIGRMRLVDELIRKHENVLIPTVYQHFRSDQWIRWSERWTIMFQRNFERPPREDRYLEDIRRFDRELAEKIRSSIYSGRLPQLFNDAVKDTRREMISLGRSVEMIKQHAQESLHATERANKESNPDDVSNETRQAEYHGAIYRRSLNALSARITANTALMRQRAKVDLQYAADLGLLRRAMANVNRDGFKPYNEEPAEQVHDHLRNAIKVLAGAHEAQKSAAELNALLVAEQSLEDKVSSRFDHHVWLERYQKVMEFPVRHMQEAGVDWHKYLEGLDRTRYNDQYNRSRERISKRLWDTKEIEPASFQLEQLQTQLTEGFVALEPIKIAARATIKRYTLSIPEQAREAAEKAKESKEETDRRQDQKKETAEELAEKQKEAEKAAKDTVQSLVDKANTSDLTDQDERELARDADAAAEMIQQAVEEAEKEMASASKAETEQDREDALERSEQAMEKLAETLEKTAEHFERAENGEDVSESREELRQAEQELGVNEDLERRYEEAEKMAEQANSDPRELMKQLEEELKKNEAMQQELSEISEQSANRAQDALEDAAEREAELNRQLERTDSALQEEKRRTAAKLDELARRARNVKDQTLNAAEQAASKGKDNEAQEKLQEARRKLEEAAQKAGEVRGDNSLAEEIEQAAQEMRKAMNEAGRANQDAKETSEQSSKEEIHDDKAERQSAELEMKRLAQNLRNQRVRQLGQDEKVWQQKEREAEARRRNAERQAAQAKRDRERAEDASKKNPENKSLQSQVEQLQQREDAAREAEKAAEESKDFAKQQASEAKQRRQEMSKQKTPSLDQPNPASELAENLAEQAMKEMKEIAEDLDSIAKEMKDSEASEPNANQAEQLANNQEQINQDVGKAQEDVERAARHEERLGQEQLAEQLSDAAESIKQNAGERGEEAQEALEQAANERQTGELQNRDPQNGDPQNGEPQNGEPKEGDQEQGDQGAAEKVAEAREAIAEEAEKLAEMLEQMSPSQQGEQSQGEQGQQQQGQQQQGQQQQGQQQQGEQQQGQQQQGQQQQGQQQQGQQQQGQQQQGQQQQGQQQQGQQQQGQQQQGQQQQGQEGPLSNQTPQELAQTLDELDQAIAANEQMSQQQGQSESQQPGQSSESSQQQGQPQQGQSQQGESQQGQSQQGDSQQGQPQQGQPQQSGQQGQTAGQLSKTLAQILEQQRQQAARDRQQMQQGPSESRGENSQNENQSEQPGQPGEESGSGQNMPEGEGVLPEFAADEMGEWGQLRSQRTEDASESKANRVAPQYRRELEAYFKAVAKRAAEKADK